MKYIYKPYESEIQRPEILAKLRLEGLPIPEGILHVVASNLGASQEELCQALEPFLEDGDPGVRFHAARARAIIMGAPHLVLEKIYGEPDDNGKFIDIFEIGSLIEGFEIVRTDELKKCLIDCLEHLAEADPDTFSEVTFGLVAEKPTTKRSERAFRCGFLFLSDNIKIEFLKNCLLCFYDINKSSVCFSLLMEPWKDSGKEALDFCRKVIFSSEFHLITKKNAIDFLKEFLSLGYPRVDTSAFADDAASLFSEVIDSIEDPCVRVKAITAIRECGRNAGSQAVGALTCALGKDPLEVRLAACSTLGWLGNEAREEQVIAKLCELLASEESVILPEAVKALRLIDPEGNMICKSPNSNSLIVLVRELRKIGDSASVLRRKLQEHLRDAGTKNTASESTAKPAETEPQKKSIPYKKDECKHFSTITEISIKIGKSTKTVSKYIKDPKQPFYKVSTGYFAVSRSYINSRNKKNK